METSHVETRQQNNVGSYVVANIDAPQRDSTTVATSIKEMLHKLKPITEECSIYQVSKRLHKIDSTVYAPQAISIGPFHHGQQELMAMEQLKLRFLDRYLCHAEMEVEAAVVIARDCETRARKCYAEPINMDRDDFVKMMLFDGCFLVEVFIMSHDFFETETESCYPLFSGISTDLLQDVILLENQLPYFILECLFSRRFNQQSMHMHSMVDYYASCFLTSWYIGGAVFPNVKPIRKPNHLVDLLSFFYDIPQKTRIFNIWERPPTATELSEAGVKFQNVTAYEHHITEICFEGDVLKIPPFQITVTFETHVRNLRAFEHYYHPGHGKKCLQYFSFLDDLISTEKDVNLLMEAGIISNNIGGGNEDIAKLFNGMVKHANITSTCYYYSQISLDLREYCKTPCHRWMASLRRDYFNTPWASVSFPAATSLILLTVAQTIYSALSYSK